MSSTELDQNVIVLRHGDRRDLLDPSWLDTAERPWDPPLADPGLARAYRTGLELRSRLDFPIQRVFISPFLRCVQTAAEVVSGLCSDGPGHADPSNMKVSIEFGLCEMLNKEAIRPEIAPKDGKFSFNIPELEAMLPFGTVDHAAEKIYKEMPRYGETASETRSRYERVIQALADKYPSENLLLVTHGECVWTWYSFLMKGGVDYEIPDYCAYVHAKRHITSGVSELFEAGSFQLITAPETTGLRHHPASGLSDGV